MQRQINAGHLSFQKCHVEVLPGYVDRPRPKDLRITLPVGDVVGGELLPMFSPSSLGTFTVDCRRKWVLYAIDKQAKETTKAQALGTALHAQLEEWLSHGKPPSSDRLTDSDALRHFPLPKTRGLKVESVFVVECVDHQAEDKLYLWGFKDVELVLPGRYRCWDLKSTASFDWKKNESELATDVQGCVYALDGLLSGDYDHAVLQWVYVRTKGAPKCEDTCVTLDQSDVVTVIGDLIPRAREMAALKAQAAALELKPKLFGLSVVPSPIACGKYGGCEYRSLCTDLKRGSIFRATREQKLLAATRHDARLGKQATGERHVSSLLAKMTAKAPGAVASATRVAVAGPSAKPAQATPPPAPVVALAKPEPPVKHPPKLSPGVGSTPMPLLKPRETPLPTLKSQAVREPPPKVPPPPRVRYVPPTPSPLQSLKAAQAQKIEQLALPTGINAADARPAPELPSEEPAQAELEGQEAELEADQTPENIPESANSDAPEAEEAPKPRRGRPPKGQNKSSAAQDAPGAPIATRRARTSGPDPIADRGASGEAGFGGLVLLLDTAPMKGLAVQDIEEIVGPARRKVEEDAAMPYRFIEFNKGPAIVANEIEQVIDDLSGVYTVDTKVIDREVLEVLMRKATTVLRGI